MMLRFAVLASCSCELHAWNLPQFSWETLPVAFHSSNPGGPYSDAQLTNMSKFSMVAIEKWQGTHNYPDPGYNWLNCEPAENPADVSKCGCCVEDEMVDLGRRLKAMRPEVHVLEYVNSQQTYPHYRLGHAVAARPDLWLHNTDGELCTANEGRFLIPDLAKQEAQDMWYNSIFNVTQTGYIDGVFVDGCAKDIPDCHTPNRQAGKMDMLKKLQEDIPGVVICGSNGKVADGLGGSQIQNWGKGEHWSTREIPMLQKAVKAGVLFQAHGSCLTDLTDQKQVNDLSSFLVAAGPHSYYVCGGWNSASTEWFEIYDRPIGAPLADAVLSEDGVYSRSFKHGVSVTFDTKTETGSVSWASSVIV